MFLGSAELKLFFTNVVEDCKKSYLLFPSITDTEDKKATEVFAA